MNTDSLLSGYNQKKLSVGALGGHSGLDVAHGANMYGFSSVVVAQAGRENTYERMKKRGKGDRARGCIDNLIVVDKFQDILRPAIQKQLRELNTIFVHNRYFWVYFDDFSKVENDFNVPIFGSRHLLKLEERDQPFNQYDLLKKAGIRMPKIFKSPKDIDRPALVKASEAARGYERAFFSVINSANYEHEAETRIQSGEITKEGLKKATIEELIVGAPVNFNFFWSPLTEELELLGTDTRRQTNLDGFLRLTSQEQANLAGAIPKKMIETGHIAVTVKESLLEKAYDLGEKFVKATQSLDKKLDPAQKGIIGPFALQGAVVAEEGKEDIVIFDVSLRIPGSPGTRATPYSGYLHGKSMSVGERIGLELQTAVNEKRLEEVVT